MWTVGEGKLEREKAILRERGESSAKGIERQKKSNWATEVGVISSSLRKSLPLHSEGVVAPLHNQHADNLSGRR